MDRPPTFNNEGYPIAGWLPNGNAIVMIHGQEVEDTSTSEWDVHETQDDDGERSRSAARVIAGIATVAVMAGVAGMSAAFGYYRVPNPFAREGANIQTIVSDYKWAIDHLGDLADIAGAVRNLP